MVGCIALEMNQKCLNKLIETFGEGVYTNDVDKAFVICRDSLISQFKEGCKRIVNVETAIEIIRTYCKLGLKLEENTWNEMQTHRIIDVKMMCKCIFSELPNLRLYNNGIPDDQSVVPNLLSLSVALSYLSQEQYSFYLNRNSGFQIEILKDCFSFTMIDNAFIQKNYQLADSLSYDYLKGTVEKIDGIRDFSKKMIEIYGEPASELFNIIYEDNPCEIIDLSSLFEKFKENEFL